MTAARPYTWFDCCPPIVARGRGRDGRRIVVLLHAVDCDEPTDRRRSIGPVPVPEHQPRSR